MAPLFVAMLAKLGVETGIDVIGAWKRAEQPTDAEIRALFIKDNPENLLRHWGQQE